MGLSQVLLLLLLHVQVIFALAIVCSIGSLGDRVLLQVERAASRVASPPRSIATTTGIQQKIKRKKRLQGGGGSVFVNNNIDSSADRSSSAGSGASANKLSQPEVDADKRGSKEKQVWRALSKLENDMQILDLIAGKKPQLSVLEFSLLTAAVFTAASGPILPFTSISEFLAPSSAALCAAIGIGAEYVGKVAVADSKEVAAATIQCAAEAEGLLANAERAKAITPLCVGVAATAASFALLVPVLLDGLGVANNLQLITEVYLCCPLVAVLAAAVASLALQETKSYANLAVGVGTRRFSRSSVVGRTWLSSTELIQKKSLSAGDKWKSFSFSVLPAPLLGSLIPGALPTKTIVVAALAAAQSAFFTAQAEYVLSRATDAVALKARSAAVCDTYANQGARSAAILPFTSALSGLCAAATAAIVELPFLETLATAGTASSTLLHMVIVAAFPTLSALFAAAASVSKARCEVDAEASMLAASTMSLPFDNKGEDPILRPIMGVRELIRLSFENSIREPIFRWFRRYRFGSTWSSVQNWFQRRIIRRSDNDEAEEAAIAV